MVARPRGSFAHQSRRGFAAGWRLTVVPSDGRFTRPVGCGETPPRRVCIDGCAGARSSGMLASSHGFFVSHGIFHGRNASNQSVELTATRRAIIFYHD